MRRFAFALALSCAALVACDDEPTDPPAEMPDADAMTGGGGTGGTPAEDVGPPPDAGCGCSGAQTCDEAGQCVEPETCADDVDCLPGRLCLDGACARACVQDGDCDDGERCDPDAAVCVVDERCGDDGDCPDGACVDGGCVAPCAEDSCPGMQVCDPATGDCAEPPSCVDDVDCLDPRICVDGGCLTPCGEDADCPGAQRCEDGQCAEPGVCADDADCAADRLCVAGACADPCGRAGCPGAQVCDGGSGRCEEADPCAGDDGCFAGRRCAEGLCVEPCADNAECPGATICEDGLCVPPSDCAFDAACGPGRICVEGQCQDGCPTMACPPDAVCDEASGRCVVEGGCVEAADCSGAQRCEGGRCVEPPVCNGDADCLGERVCRDGLCVGLCDRDADCPGTQLCDGGQCGEGPACEGDADCLAGRRCHPALGVCTERCPDGFCPGGLVCGGDGLCAEPPGGCLDDAECAGARVCRVGACFSISARDECADRADCPAGACVDFGCADAVPGACDCPAGWACVDDGCEAPGPCGACPDGWHCADDGLCQRCLDDGHCPGDGRCDDGTCVDPPACEADGDCLDGHACEFGRCVIDFAACTDDAVGGAGPDLARSLPPVALDGLWACEGRPDWFRIGDADAGSRVTLRFAADAAPPTLRIYALADLITPVATAATQPGEARAAVGPGDYLVEVAAAPGASTRYGIDIEDGLACADDPYERPWRNDDARTARLIGPGTVRGTLCGNEEDFFEVGLARRLQIDIDGANADVDGRRAPIAVDGPATIRVSGLARAQYSLTVTPVADPNGACAAAEPLRLGESTDATVEAGGDDFAPACRGPGGPERVFRVSVPRAGRLTATLEGLDARGSVLLYRDCGAEPVACAAAAGGIDTAVEAGDYHLVVDGPYVGDVRVELAALSRLCEGPPALAPGATPIALPVGPADIGGPCTDPDLGAAVYTVDVDAPSIARLSLDGGGAGALVSLRAACDADADLGCGIAPGPAVAPRLEPGTYFAIIQGEGEVIANLELVPADDLAGFADACDGAVLAADGADAPLEGDLTVAGDTVDLALCGGLPASPDAILRFRLDGRAQVTAFIEAAGFGARLAVVDGDCGAVLECGSPMTGDVVADLDAGTYGLVIEADGLGGGPFRVRLQVR